MEMIRQIKSTYQPYMLRPIVYKSFTKLSIGLALALLWDRFINVNEIYYLVRDAFFVVGVFFLACVWFQYLRMDGVSVDHSHKPEKKERKNFLAKDIVDYVDEKIVSYEELEKDEQAVCRIMSNIVCCCIFLISALISMAIL